MESFVIRSDNKSSDMNVDIIIQTPSDIKADTDN